MFRMFFVLAILANIGYAHEMTPTYPKFKTSFVENVSVTTMKFWNRRSDVNYYEIGVFDEEWNALPFASESRIIKVDYLEHKDFDVYIRRKDLDNVEYICTTSKLLKEQVTSTGVKSMICSRVK